MQSVKVLCGVPGSGKSTYAAKHFPGAMVVSADQYFMKDGEYCFNPKKLPEAHAECLKAFVNLINPPLGTNFPVYTLVVDNTNITVAEIAPYAALALAYGYELEIVSLSVLPEVAHARNIHKVPLESIKRMAQKMDEEQRRLPPWWPHRQVLSQPVGF